MKLLIKRDRNRLEKTAGEAIVDKNVPCFLKVPRVVNQNEVMKIESRENNDDLLIASSSDYSTIEDHLVSVNNSFSSVGNLLFTDAMKAKFSPRSIPGLWSGYRSSLVYDPTTKKLYRLKGISLNPENPEIKRFEDGFFWIIGGQKLSNVETEREMSDAFNKVLGNHGIEPVMEYRGLWKFSRPEKGSRKIRETRPAASIYEVLGDTRLDEFMLIFENLLGSKISPNSVLTRNGELLLNSALWLYYRMGFAVGELKKLMDVNNQTWSCDSERTNAHIGNIVLYNGSDRFRIGLVDFDASLHRKTAGSIKYLQKREYNTLLESFRRGPVSIREIQMIVPSAGLAFMPELREAAASGFIKGYESSLKNVSNHINLTNGGALGIEVLYQIFSSLRARSEELFVALPKIKITDSISTADRWQKDDMHYYTKRRRHKTHSLDEMISYNIGYQRKLNKNNYNSALDDIYSTFDLISYSGKNDVKEDHYLQKI
ncbi:MAG: hypothetical protein AABW41_02790 [Nanoarchaeota archaeon]